VLLFPISVAAQQTPKVEVFGGYSYLQLTEQSRILVEIRQSERLERFGEAQRDAPDRFACRFQQPLWTAGADPVHDQQPNYAG